MTSPSGPVRLVVAGGGTGGHFFPAVAIADRICELTGGDCRRNILFVGTPRGIEYRLRESLPYELRLIGVRGLARRLTLQNLAVPFLALRALWQSRALLKEFRPDVVLGTGGYVCWPVLKAAAMMKIPTVLQEQNSFPGVTTRQAAKAATRIYLGFDEARRHLPAALPAITTGNPVRKSVMTGDRKQAQQYFNLDPERRTILILGGSQGARSINEAVLKSLEKNSLPERCQLLWQTGQNEFEKMKALMGDQHREVHLFPFEQRMDLVYAAADLAIARAGAISLAEIESVSLPSLLIPYPQAAGDHQRMNARASAALGHSEVIDPDDLSGIDLLGHAGKMFGDGRVERIRQNIRQHLAGRKPAVDVIAEDILRIVAKAQEAAIDR
jgi:UDP-N-acetylglucosamine--N-acetylmuramyl-(pentapeptide) pyrophosphoryl-undecaprenol N-acetylglucosamine transferase